MKKLFLIRHGETEWNKSNRIQGSIDIPLSSVGEEQIKNVARFLKSIASVEKIFTSTLKRAIKSAEIISSELNVKDIEKISLLNEINCGDWEGAYFDDLLKNSEIEFTKWLFSPEVKCPNGESVREVRKRVERFFDLYKEVLNSLEIVLIVGHGILNRAILSYLMDIPLQQARYFEQDNGAINIFYWGKIMPHLEIWNFTPGER